MENAGEIVESLATFIGLVVLLFVAGTFFLASLFVFIATYKNVFMKKGETSEPDTNRRT